MPRPIITLTTDFGTSDHYVGALKGVILGICPEAQIVDISHEIKPFAIAQGAFTLAQAYPCFPPGAIHLAIVDPGVGSRRRPLLLEADGHRFVGPDNGVFTWALDRDPAWRARIIDAPALYRHPVSSTFHGRDVFAPVAAHLARGVPVEQMGGAVSNPVRLVLVRESSDPAESIAGVVLSVDRFGNVITSLRREDVPELSEKQFELAVGTVFVRGYRKSYSDADEGELFVIEGSSGYLEVSINQSDAAVLAGVGPGDSVFFRWRAGLVPEST